MSSTTTQKHTGAFSPTNERDFHVELWGWMTAHRLEFGTLKSLAHSDGKVAQCLRDSH